MGLFDSIRRVVGGGDDDADDDDDAATQPDLINTHDLDVAALRERADGVAGEVEVLDFSLDSLAQFDDAIDAGYDEALATSDTPGAYATDTVRFGCYLGEVLVRTYDGEWTRNPDWGVTISGPDGTTTVAVFDVAERSITTGAVFAAVADRAAVEVGLDGVTADSDSEPSTAESEGDDVDDDTQPASADATPAEDPDVPTDDGLTAGDLTVDEPTAGVADDELVTADPSVDGSSDDTPAADEPSDDTPMVETPGDESTADDTADVPDPVSADPALNDSESEVADGFDSEPDDDSDTEPLIKEAEPESVTDEAGLTQTDEPGGTETAPADEPGDTEPAPTEPTESSESLFADDAAGAGPTVDDAPSAEDGPLAPPSDPESDGAPADGVDGDDDTAPEAESVAPSADTDSSDGPTDEADPTDGDGLRATYAETADELVSFWTEYDLDYTPESLSRLDELVSEEWDDDRFDDAEFGSDESFDDRVFTSVSTELGSYFGEVLIRELDAEWSDATATDGVVVEGAEGPLAIPVFKVAGTSIKQQPVFARSYDSLLSDLDA